MGFADIAWRLRVAVKGAFAWLIRLLPSSFHKHEVADPQPVPVERWRLLSEPVLAQITGRSEPLSRAEAVLRLRLKDYEGFPSTPYDDRRWTHLYHYAGLFYVEVSISNTGMDLGWGPSMQPGADPLYAGLAVEAWVEEQDCLDRLAPIAALDPNLPRAMAGLRISGVPISLGMAALDVFLEVVPGIFHGWFDLNEVAEEVRAMDAAEKACRGKGEAA